MKALSKKEAGILTMILLVALGFVNLTLSTIYYNWIDKGMGEIRRDFKENGPGTGGTRKECEAPCKQIATYYVGSSVLQKRDQYCARHNLIRIGGWYIRHNVIFESNRVDSFSFYFKTFW